MALWLYQTCRQTARPLLPVHIQAHNSLLFYASTLVSPTLSMLLLMQQMFRRRHSQLPIKIGQQIAWDNWFSSPFVT
jgi:putative hemolysin